MKPNCQPIISEFFMTLQPISYVGKNVAKISMAKMLTVKMPDIVSVALYLHYSVFFLTWAEMKGKASDVISNQVPRSWSRKLFSLFKEVRMVCEEKDGKKWDFKR